MSIFLDTRGNSTLGIGLCDRCGYKFPLGELFSDPNFPGLKVDKRCLDVLDPYRLPAHQTENVSMQFVRPETPIDVNVLALYSPDASIYITGQNASGETIWLIP